MRSPLGKECRKLFRKLMAVELPDYKEDKSQVTRQGAYAWTHKHPSGIWFYIILVLNSKADKFTLEVAWDFNGKIPYQSQSGMIIEHPIFFRFSELWCSYDHWWLLVLRPEEYQKVICYKNDPIEQCLPLVAPAVWEAGEKLKEHLIPVFEKIVSKHGSIQPK